MSLEINKKFILYLLVALAAIPFIVVESKPLEACSTFTIKTSKNLVYGRSFDFSSGAAYLMLNKRDLVKTAFVYPGITPAQWTSKNGSITFNQAGKEFPYGGMNEKGLVIAQMACDGEQIFCPADERPALRDLQWIQYQLDMSETVQDVINSNKKIRISSDSVSLHFLILDRYGNSAVIEHIGGKFTYYTGKELPVSVLSNDLYSESLKFSQPYLRSKKIDDILGKVGSSERFARAAVLKAKYEAKPDKPAVAYAFTILDNVSRENTRYSAVFEPLKLRIHFKTQKNKNIRTINLKDFNFDCSAPVLAIYIDENDVAPARWEPFTLELNTKLVERAMEESELIRNALTAIKELWIKYPMSIKCKSAE